MPENKKVELDVSANPNSSPVKDSPSTPNKSPVNGGSPTGKPRGPSSPGQVGALNNCHALTMKAAQKVQEGLPWPEDAPVAHDARNLAATCNVPWHTGKVRECLIISLHCSQLPEVSITFMPNQNYGS